jgi:hypothetical protein
MFSGPEALNRCLEHFKNAMQKGDRGAARSLLDTVTAMAFVIDVKDHYTWCHS